MLADSNAGEMMVACAIVPFQVWFLSCANYSRLLSRQRFVSTVSGVALTRSQALKMIGAERPVQNDCVLPFKRHENGQSLSLSMINCFQFQLIPKGSVLTITCVFTEHDLLKSNCFATYQNFYS
eukprot:m.286070 g.286070  ORF g.286070 m.286070 type:complete len:124 (-) comp15778_c0_seq35:1213-1584(-)